MWGFNEEKDSFSHNQNEIYSTLDVPLELCGGFYLKNGGTRGVYNIFVLKSCIVGLNLSVFGSVINYNKHRSKQKAESKVHAIFIYLGFSIHYDLVCLTHILYTFIHNTHFLLKLEYKLLLPLLFTCF